MNSLYSLERRFYSIRNTNYKVNTFQYIDVANTTVKQHVLSSIRRSEMRIFYRDLFCNLDFRLTLHTMGLINFTVAATSPFMMKWPQSWQLKGSGRLQPLSLFLAERPGAKGRTIISSRHGVWHTGRRLGKSESEQTQA